jgi:transcriptional/translational regulatory protein YebC/TACO1
MEAALEAGAEDVESPDPHDGDEGYWAVYTEPAEFLQVREAIEAAGIEIAEAEVSKIADTTVTLEGEDATKLSNLIDILEDNDDVQKVYTNAEWNDE